ncbi:MAG: hypothetical protein ACTS6H_02960 [Candidatus Hodgkinia cicadicola]
MDAIGGKTLLSSLLSIPFHVCGLALIAQSLSQVEGRHRPICGVCYCWTPLG